LLWFQSVITQSEGDNAKKDPYLEVIFLIPVLFVGILGKNGRVVGVSGSTLDFIDQELETVIGENFWKTARWKHSSDLVRRVKRGGSECK